MKIEHAELNGLISGMNIAVNGITWQEDITKCEYLYLKDGAERVLEILSSMNHVELESNSVTKEVNINKTDRIDIYLYTWCEINKKELESAVMYFFEIDTAQQKDSYNGSDNDLRHPSPINASCEGMFPEIFIEKPYRVIIKDRFGLFLFENKYE